MTAVSAVWIALSRDSSCQLNTFCVCSCCSEIFSRIRKAVAFNFACDGSWGLAQNNNHLKSVCVPAHGCWTDVVKILTFPDKLLMSAVSRMGS
jgi:hypothetical protein